MNGGKNNGPTSKIIKKVLAAVIILIAIIYIVMDNVLENEESINIGSLETLHEEVELEQVFHERKEILDRSCSFIKQLNTANRIATVKELKEIHLLLHDLAKSRDNIASKLEPFDETEMRLNKLQYGIIDGVGAPFNLLYCTPPKSGTTSWQRGVAVLKDFVKGIQRKPEDYVPRQLFDLRWGHALNPYTYKYHLPKRYSKGQNWTKIVVGRNPLERLLSAWKDKSRTFRFENGTVDWDKARVVKIVKIATIAHCNHCKIAILVYNSTKGYC